MNNENHLLQLLNNQTSVIESTINIVKSQEKEIEHEHLSIIELVSHINQTVNNQENFQNCVLITLQINQMLNNLESLEASISGA